SAATALPALSPTTPEPRALPSSPAMARPMPRDPPVTRAVRPSSEQNSGSGDGLLCLLQAGDVVHGDRLHGAIDPLDEPGQDVARPDLDEHLHALLDQPAGGLGELDR